MLNVLIVEDQQLIREGLVALLSLEADLTIWGEAENGQAALDLLAAKATQGRPDTGAPDVGLPDVGLPDVALMDMRMPVMDGVAATERIAQQYPTIKVLVLTTFDDDALIAQSLAVGAKGYLLKDTPSEELAMAIRSVAKGYSHFGPGIVQKMMGTIQSNPSQSSPGQSNPGQSNPGQLVPAEVSDAVEPSDCAEIEALTPREKEVLIHIGQGASNREIAKALHLSEGTIKNHVTRILSQLGLRDRTQAALLIHSHNQLGSQFDSQYRK